MQDHYKFRNNNALIIGVCGNKTVGKDLFYSLCKNYLEKNNSKLRVVRESIGDLVRYDLKQWLTKHYNINPFNCSAEEKELIRPFLVAHGYAKRQQCQGPYWVERIQQKINNYKGKNKTIVFIPDVRYTDEFEYDQADLIRASNGVLVYIDCFYEKDGKTIYKKPANDHEKYFHPKLKKRSCYHVCWRDSKMCEYEVDLGRYIENFVSWLYKNKYLT